jgi:hypothetical protein
MRAAREPAPDGVEAMNPDALLNRNLPNGTVPGLTCCRYK